jgi:hypothetical protein
MSGRVDELDDCHCVPRAVIPACPLRDNPATANRHAADTSSTPKMKPAVERKLASDKEVRPARLAMDSARRGPITTTAKNLYEVIKKQEHWSREHSSAVRWRDRLSEKRSAHDESHL